MSAGDDGAIGSDPRLLILSCQTGQEVCSHDGLRVGLLADLSVDLDKQTAGGLVERLLVQRRRAPDLLLPWALIESFTHSRVVLRHGADAIGFAVASAADRLGDDEILLNRDVLDTQIVDVAGQRLARVADVVLSETAEKRLMLVGVEVGFGGVLRRLGLAFLAAHLRDDVVAWTDLHLTSERGHAVQLATPRSAVHHLDATGLAALVDRVDTESAAEILAGTKPRIAAGVVGAADPLVGERLLRAMPEGDVAKIVAAMPAEHATRWRARLAQSPTMLGRHFLRSRVWPRRRRRPATEAR